MKIWNSKRLGKNERLIIAARLFLLAILAGILIWAAACHNVKAAPRPEFDIDDILLLAAAMELENGCNSDLCLLYTGSVIINRVNSPRFPDTIYGVLHQKGQYAAWTLRHLDTVKISERTLSLALKLAMCGSLDTEIIFQSMHPELGRVKYHIDTEYFATE